MTGALLAVSDVDSLCGAKPSVRFLHFFCCLLSIDFRFDYAIDYIYGGRAVRTPFCLILHSHFLFAGTLLISLSCVNTRMAGVPNFRYDDVQAPIVPMRLSSLRNTASHASTVL